MRRILPFLLFIFGLFSHGSFAQTFGNEWIDYSQTYYKFKILQTGIYRLNYTDLTNASVPITSFASENIQIFGREQEIPLHIVDGGDNSMDPGDYILFYAQKNDGWLDSTLYPVADQIGNPAYSLYNDTLYYFFTWNNSNTNKRFIVETDSDFNSYSPASHIDWMYETEFHSAYFEGVNLASASTSYFNELEGFCGPNYQGPFTYNFNIPTAFPYNGLGASQPKVKIHSFGSNNPENAPNGFNHHLRYFVGASDFLLLDTLFQGVIAMPFETTFGANLLSNGTTSFKWNNVGDLPVTSDLQGFSYLQLRYPKLPNLTGFSRGSFIVRNANLASKIRLDLVWNSNNPVVFSFGSQARKLNAVSNGSGFVQILVPNENLGTEQTLVFDDENNFLSVNSLSLVSATGKFKDFSQNLPDSALLMVYHKSLEAATLEYKSYRESMDGGAYSVIAAEVDELYLQFGGGIPKHINGIRRFAHYVYTLSNQKPAALFLLGKGVREAIVYTTTATGIGTRGSSQIYAQSLVPSFGQPSSDVAITASLIPNNWVPLIPTGRISVTTNQELQNYLNKVIEQEAAIDSTSNYHSDSKDWQKQIMHFAGGTTQSDQLDFRYFLEQMENIIETENFGGNVTRIYKNNSDPLDPSTFTEIAEKLSSGVSIMNFFGHANSQTSGFEINLDEPSNWNNQGKYPLVIANTCYNGNIFFHENLGFSTSEKFVRAVNSGAIGFISTVGLGFAGTLNSYTNALYREMSQNSYGKTIGKQIQNAIASLPYNTGIGAILTESAALQMTFNGDPLLHVNWHTKPEIELLEQNVSFGPSNIDLGVDSISVQIELTNLGKSITDTIVVEIRRNFPQSTLDSVYYEFLPELHYKQILELKLPLQPNIGIGLNQFTISVDIPSFADEVYDEANNNQITKNLFINLDGIQPVAPTDFAVVPDDSVVLKGSTIDPLAGTLTYRFEVDTTDLFNSPAHRYQEISSAGGVIEAFPSQWKLMSNNQVSSLQCTDSTVYFWRVALVEPTLIWRERSFQYIVNKSGWGQDHFFQREENTFQQLDYDRPNRKLHFTPGDTSWAEVFAYGTNVPTSQNQWLINNTQQEYDLCTVIPSLHVAVIDPITMDAWGKRWINAQGDTINPDHGFGNVNDLFSCRNRVEKYFIFRQNSATQLAAFQNMVLNDVPNGHYLIIYAPYTGALYNNWNALDSLGMYSTFSALGSDSINGSRPNTPMAFFVKKGDPNSVIELFGQNANDPVHLKAPMVGVDFVGQEISSFIGPALQWGNFYWKQDAEEAISTDSTTLAIESFDINKNLLNTTFFPVSAIDSILQLETTISAINAPFLRLRSTTTDSVNTSPAQLDRWHVLYTPAPEAAIDGANGFLWSASADSIQEGSDVSFAIDIRNISEVDMDSLLVHYFIEDENHVKHYLPYERQDSLRVNQTFRDTISFSTFGYAGQNIFWMEVNPYTGPGGTTDQPEQFHFNNLLQIPIFVKGDDRNPLLDVTFDGRHILNNDIVNPFSEILITLKDDNPLLIMNEIADTALFGIYLTDPKGVQKRIPFELNGQSVLQWIPATAQNKRFKIVYPGAFLEDGKYTLLVQGSDKSGNLSGDLDYRIVFEVITESSITRLMNYPNPFSTSTRFVFTLTGTEVPDDVLIQIMTVSGKVVREINESELGPIYIGRNVTEFAWDGRDQFGDQLANGVYLYRVQMKLNGQDMKQRTSAADAYFTKEFGKMYLLR